MKSTLLTAAVATLVFASAPLYAQQSETDARINASLETALAAGIPVELLQSKIAEGRAKGVAEERIAAAVEARLRGLTRAQEAMQRAEIENTTAAELAVTADALEAGVSENTVIKISRAAPAERRAVAIATLTGLVQLGHASEQALARVSAAVRSNAEMARLNADVSSQLQGRGLGTGVSGVVRGGVRVN